MNSHLKQQPNQAAIEINLEMHITCIKGFHSSKQAISSQVINTEQKW